MYHKLNEGGGNNDSSHCSYPYILCIQCRLYICILGLYCRSPTHSFKFQIQIWNPTNWVVTETYKVYKTEFFLMNFNVLNWTLLYTVQYRTKVPYWCNVPYWYNVPYWCIVPYWYNVPYWCIVPYCIYCDVLYCLVLNCILLYLAVLQCNALNWTEPYCILYCYVLYFNLSF